MSQIYSILVSPEANMDLVEAIEWYESQREGLGMEFSLKFEAAARLLESNPYLYAKIYKEVHRNLITKFPYAIFYEILEEEKEVGIIAVMHTSRHPQIWQGRVKA